MNSPALLLPSNVTVATPQSTLVTFTVNGPDGKLKPSIIHCFISHMLLDIDNPPATIRASNGQVYIAVYDNIMLPKDSKVTHIKVIVSFQQHTDGNYAVVRNLNINSSSPSF